MLPRNHFKVGDKVRYKPGHGTYGHEDRLDVDGRIPGIVMGFTDTRVRVQIIIDRRKIGGPRLEKEIRVDVRSLIADVQ